MVGAIPLWYQFRSKEVPQQTRRIPMMTTCGPGRHNLRQHRDHDVLGRGKGLKLAQLVANLNVNGVKVVISHLGSFHHIRQPEGRLLFRGRRVTLEPDPLWKGCTGRSQAGFLVYRPVVVTSLRLVTSFVVQKGILLEIFGLRLNQFGACNACWRTVFQGMACLTVLGISRLSVEAGA